MACHFMILNYKVIRVQTCSGAHPNLLFNGYRGLLRLSPEISWPERAADYSLPSSVEAKNVCIYISTPIRRLHGVVLN